MTEQIALERCGRKGCNPRRITREGGEHVGVDLLVKCSLCKRESGHVECWSPTDEGRKLVGADWNASIRGPIADETVSA